MAKDKSPEPKSSLLTAEDQHRPRGFVHVKLVDEPLVRLAAKIPSLVVFTPFAWRSSLAPRSFRSNNSFCS
ncbi:MAG: hypothetical protein HYR55_19150 [Acidobacteria bacterium]|nr:hypothetical protein [Acidobacteriota bacterium]MBI3658755.1 hypothetical protein [Acidobacteriota bacterium]